MNKTKILVLLLILNIIINLYLFLGNKINYQTLKDEAYYEMQKKIDKEKEGYTIILNNDIPFKSWAFWHKIFSIIKKIDKEISKTDINKIEIKTNIQDEIEYIMIHYNRQMVK